MGEKYKGYILRSYSYETEEMESSGCSSQKAEGTGRYYTVSGYEVIDPKTGKSFSVSGGLDEARQEIDKLKSPEARKAKLLLKKIERETKILETKISQKKQLLDEQLWEARKRERDLKEQLRNKLAKDFY